jgi:hypothetical protein
MNTVTEQQNSTIIRVNISPSDRRKAKAYAKSQGYSFGGWLALLISREITKCEGERREA